MDGEVVVAVFPGVAAMPLLRAVGRSVVDHLATRRIELHGARRIGNKREAVAFPGRKLEPVYRVAGGHRYLLCGVTLNGVGHHGLAHAPVHIFFRLAHHAVLAVPKAEADAVLGIYDGSTAV